MIRIKTDHKFTKEDFFRKSLKLGYDNVAFGLEFGNRCEMIGKLSRIDGDIYKFEIDQIGKNDVPGSLNCLGRNELGIFKTALVNDYHLDEAEYKVL